MPIRLQSGSADSTSDSDEQYAPSLLRFLQRANDRESDKCKGMKGKDKGRQIPRKVLLLFISKTTASKQSLVQAAVDTSVRQVTDKGGAAVILVLFHKCVCVRAMRV